MRKIRNVKELRQSLQRGKHEYILCLNGGAFTRKTIYRDPDGTFEVVNGDNDDEYFHLTAKELFTLSNIGEGMRYGAFFQEGD